MTEPLWSDHYGLMLRKTTSDDYLFLDVNPKLTSLIKPFMELKEVKATWNPEFNGWLLPVTQFPYVNDFLEIFHEAIPELGKVTVPKVELGYATNYEISYQQLRLLVLLDPKMDTNMKDSFKAFTGTGKGKPIEDAGDENDGDYNWLEEHSSILTLEYQYLQNICFGGPTIRYGDILLHSEDVYKPEEYKRPYQHMIYSYFSLISDGSQFIPLEFDGDGFNIPGEFTVPKPFPIEYWSWAHLDRGYVPLNLTVHPTPLTAEQLKGFVVDNYGWQFELDGQTYTLLSKTLVSPLDPSLRWKPFNNDTLVLG